MSKKQPEPTLPPRERAFLVGVELRSEPGNLSLQDSLEELALLCDTAGLDVVGEITQRLDHPNSETFIGTGKVEELVALAEEYQSDIVVFDAELSPRHLRVLESQLGASVRVLDRTALILDIFGQHAHTREGILQVELAQYEYRLPRLTRAWTHLARQAGGGAGRTGSVGGVGLRGPGETQLELDRREIRHRIRTLKDELEKVRAHRQRHRQQRKSSRIPVVALVGYTNAGKSTLMNRLAGTSVLVADQLFATLDPTTRRVKLPNGQTVLFTDTVGFIQKLPTQLVAAFHATLEEIAEADLLVHVVDVSHPNALAQWRSVNQTLGELQASQIPTVTALNKVDKLNDPSLSQELITNFTNSVSISALKGTGIQELVSAIQQQLFETDNQVVVRLPYEQGQLISLFHEQGQVLKVQHQRGGVLMQGTIPGRFMVRFQPYVVKKDGKIEN